MEFKREYACLFVDAIRYSHLSQSLVLTSFKYCIYSFCLIIPYHNDVCLLPKTPRIVLRYHSSKKGVLYCIRYQYVVSATFDSLFLLVIMHFIIYITLQFG